MRQVGPAAAQRTVRLHRRGIGLSDMHPVTGRLQDLESAVTDLRIIVMAKGIDEQYDFPLTLRIRSFGLRSGKGYRSRFRE